MDFGIIQFFNPALTPIWGPIFASIIAGAIAIWVAQAYTQKIKRIEATLEFSRRYHELLKNQNEANQRFYFDDRGNRRKPPPPTTDQHKAEAYVFFFQLFDLLLNEFQFFKEGLLDSGRFANWMRWRWYDWEPTRLNDQDYPTPLNIESLGVPYKEAWNFWIERGVPTWPTDFASFMRTIHGANEPEDLDELVEQAAPRASSPKLPVALVLFALALLAGTFAASLVTPSHKDNSALSLVCNMRLLYQTGALRPGSLADYDREAKTLFGFPDIEAACKSLAR